MTSLALKVIKWLIIFPLFFAVFAGVGVLLSPDFVWGPAVFWSALLQAALWCVYAAVLPVKVKDSLGRDRTLPAALEFSFLPVLACLICTLLLIVFFSPDKTASAAALAGSVVCSFAVASSMFFVFSPVTRHIRQVNMDLGKAEARLNQALEQKKEAAGLMPVCVSCRKVRDSEGFWREVKAYLDSHAGSLEDPYLCPECEKEARMKGL